MFRNFFIAASCAAITAHGMSLSQIRSEADQGGAVDVKAYAKELNDNLMKTNEPRVPAQNSGAKVDAKAKADDKAKDKKEESYSKTYNLGPVKFKTKQPFDFEKYKKARLAEAKAGPRKHVFNTDYEKPIFKYSKEYSDDEEDLSEEAALIR